jgi:hypothetical protein
LFEPDNLQRLRAALDDLQTSSIAVPVSDPPLDSELLRRGHAFHFRCQRPDVAGLRIDFMANLRGGAAFDELRERRTSFEFEGQIVDVMSRMDLVAVKKTQRDKDWPMVTRLVEGFYFAAGDVPTATEVDYLLRELRTAELRLEAVTRFSDAACNVAHVRPAVQAAIDRSIERVVLSFRAEEDEVRRLDRE